MAETPQVTAKPQKIANGADLARASVRISAIKVRASGSGQPGSKFDLGAGFCARRSSPKYLWQRVRRFMGKVVRSYSLRGWTVMAAAALLVVGGCAGDPVTSASAAPAPLSEQVLSVGLNRIAEIYLQPVDLTKLCVDGLAGLRTLDPMLKVERSPHSVTISRGSRQVTEFAIPEDGDPNAWATLATRAMERARQFSPQLYEATSDQLYQAVFDGLLADLDSYSRYTTPQRAVSERAIREGYGGVGLALEPRGGRYQVREVTLDGRSATRTSSSASWAFHGQA